MFAGFRFPNLGRLKALGVLAAIAVGVMLVPALAQRAINPQAEHADPIGDTFGVSPLHDVTAYTATSDGNVLTMTMQFVGPITPTGAGPEAVVGYLDLDTDQNQGTGTTSHVTTEPQCAPSNLGVDYYVDLGAYCNCCGYVGVYDARGVSLAAVPMIFGPNVFTVTIPLGVLGGDNGIVHTAAIVGNETGSTDCVPNGGYLANGYTIYVPMVRK
jgi:hypothetical protein